MSHDFNFVHDDVSEEDAQALLNGFPPDHPFHDSTNTTISFEDPLVYERFDNGATLAHLMHRAGIFPSVKQARSNGWDKPVPKGYCNFVVGKRKIVVSVVNRYGDDVDAGPR